jgi:hypothetical protein
MSDPNSCHPAHDWSKVQSILKDLPLNISEFELTITKLASKEFIVQFKNLSVPVETRKLKKINPVGLHDLFW